jgi:hypothetical protein
MSPRAKDSIERDEPPSEVTGPEVFDTGEKVPKEATVTAKESGPDVFRIKEPVPTD